MIKIDSRERDLIDLFSGEEFTTEQMEVGDILIYTDKHEFLIERKTIKDMNSSLMDNRYIEQKIRMMSYKDNCKKNVKLFYLIETNGCDLFLNENKYCKGVYFNNLCKNIFKPILSKNLNETVNIIKHLQKLIKTPKKFISKSNNNKTEEQSKSFYSNIVRIKKKENINFYTYFPIILKTIPSISNTKANSIVEYFNNDIMNFMRLITNNGKKDVIEDLSNIKINNKTKLGKITAEKIYNMFVRNE